MEATAAAAAAAVSAALKKKKITARHSSTNLIMKSVAGKQIKLAVSLKSRGYFCGVLAGEKMALYLSLDFLKSFSLFVCVRVCVYVFVCEQARI